MQSVNKAAAHTPRTALGRWDVEADSVPPLIATTLHEQRPDAQSVSAEHASPIPAFPSDCAKLWKKFRENVTITIHTDARKVAIVSRGDTVTFG